MTSGCNRRIALFNLSNGARKTLFGILIHAVGACDFDLVDADESKHLAQVTTDEINRAAERGATGGNDDINTLASKQTHGTFGAVSKRNPGATDLVDPGFQRRRYCEIVHRRGEHDMVCPFEFSDEFIGLHQTLIVRFGSAVGSTEVGRYPVTVDELRLPVEIALQDFDVLVC